MTHITDELVRRAAPVTDEQVEALDLTAAEAELSSAILARTRDAPRRRARVPRRLALPRRRSLRWSLVAVAAAALALAGVSLTRDGGIATGPDRVWAAAALRVADAVPRIAIDAPGWHVERVDTLTVEQGEIAFGGDGLEAELMWLPSGKYQQYLDSNVQDAKEIPDAEEIPDVEVLGTPARAFRSFGSTYNVLWRSGGYMLQLHVQPADFHEPLAPERVLGLLDSLKLVSVDEWLGAMPASLVRPDDVQTTVERMVSDMRLPDGFDVAALADKLSLRDRYQLGAHVAGAVACDWIGRWVRASRSGDERAAADASAALASSHDWSILHEMESEGAYPEVLWEFADAIVGGGEAGQVDEVATHYRQALCDA
jgi:hypothetical protein